MRRPIASMLAAFALAACVSTTPPTSVHQPMTARSAPQAATLANGAIYQVASARPLFEDRRARFIGDTLIIQLAEKTQASKKSSTAADRNQKIAVTAPTLIGVPGKGAQGITIDANSASVFSGKGDSDAMNDFTGTITVTVIEVLPNGNLLVSGEKQVSINQGQEFVRFSGVVNPIHITGANTVTSTQVADARIEYKASGFLNEAQVMGWLARFFLTFLPF